MTKQVAHVDAARMHPDGEWRQPVPQTEASAKALQCLRMSSGLLGDGGTLHGYQQVLPKPTTKALKMNP